METMQPEDLTSMVQNLMLDFADLTGLQPQGRAPRRYLWTDAFAVCNFLELYGRTGEKRFEQLALELVGQVHDILGRHRGDDRRTGWISGLDDEHGAIHPTAGGLRIGKEMNERRFDEPYNEELEWDRDGQYYHYLTKWMHALNRVSRVRGEAVYNRWAIELAKAVHARFVYVLPSGNRKGMYWKMSIDLSCPLVSSMGHHDPLDGLVTYLQLQTAAKHFNPAAGSVLDAEVEDMVHLCRGKDWTTDDPLGIGELLSFACKLAQLILHEGLPYEDVLEVLLKSSRSSLESFEGRSFFRLPAQYRLAFRELGLSIGIRAMGKLLKLFEQAPEDSERTRSLHAQARDLIKYAPLSDVIEEYWLMPEHRNTGGWLAHRDINMVMLATSLAPDGYLSL